MIAIKVLKRFSICFEVEPTESEESRMTPRHLVEELDGFQLPPIETGTLQVDPTGVESVDQKFPFERGKFEMNIRYLSGGVR